MDNVIELLTNAGMQKADELTVKQGVPSYELMRNAGMAVADAAIELFAGRCRGEILVLCGPGNNGGDGMLAACRLVRAGFPVRVVLVGKKSALKGDAARAAAEFVEETGGVIENYDPDLMNTAVGIIDALFGSGLARPIGGRNARIVGDINASGLPVLAVDIPSGIDGDTGRVHGCAVKAARTISFFRFKPGHFLLPGKVWCGTLSLAQIGIPDKVLKDTQEGVYVNRTKLWENLFPAPRADGHKYHRGHAIAVSGGPWQTGAARLAARAALRVGAGLVTLVSPKDAAAINAAHLTTIMLKGFDGQKQFEKAIADERMNACLIGPNVGVGDETRDRVLSLLKTNKRLVLDADALTSFEMQPSKLFRAIKERRLPTILTPHDGEFGKLFDQEEAPLDRLALARMGAKTSGAVVVLKGADTVIAEPSGRSAINVNGCRWLATAGSGDVLAGLITGLLAQGMPTFEAACAAVYLHAAVAERVGPGLIAEDLADQLPFVLASLMS